MSDDDAERITREFVAWKQAADERRDLALELLACLDQDLMAWALAEVDGGAADDSYEHVLTWLSQHAERDGDIVAEALILARWPRAVKRAGRLSAAATASESCTDPDGHATTFLGGDVIAWTRFFKRTRKCPKCNLPVVKP